MVAACAAAGCAVCYTDTAGRVHTVGLVWQTAVPALPETKGDALPRFTFRLGPQTDSAALFRQRTLGAVVTWTDFNRGLTLGYSEQLVARPAVAEGLTTFDFDSTAPFDARVSFQPFPPPLLTPASP